MADLKIKAGAGSTNKLLIQSQDQSNNDYAIQIGDGGAATINHLVLKPGSAPSSPTEGSMYYDSTSDTVKVRNASSWLTLRNWGTTKANGGTITSWSDGTTSYVVHTFTTSGVFTPTSSFNVDYLVVAGGAAGGHSNTNSGGGGGAGGYRTATGFSVTAQDYTITVGAGGAVASNVRGANGGDSIFSSITSTGGGGGGSQGVSANGKAGGSGGGGAYNAGAGGAGTSGQGNAGGTVAADGGNAAGGAGGGAGGAGEGASQASNSATQAGDGGVGLQNAYRTGSNVYYAGGGAGEGYDLGVADGGTGGGGSSGIYQSNANATPNTGGGGAGGSNGGINHPAGSGGSGIVVIRYTI